ncbi:MAG: hypothetical protein JSV97_04670, partial [candidate division WOR-3 bacterium]
MSKKHKHKPSLPKEAKPAFIETYWDKIVIILLIVVPLIYFSSFLNADKMIAGSDYLIGGYPFEKWTAEQQEMPLWYPHVFGGVPVLGAPVGGPLAPLAQLKEIIPPHVVLALTFIVLFFLAGIGMYLYLKEIGLSPYSAALGAVIYQFIGNLATSPSAGHAGRAASIATFPLMLFCVHRALASKRLLYFVITALITAFAFYEGHFQITYYGLLFITAYVIYYLISKRKENSKKDVIKIIGYGVVSIALICLLMAAIWLPVLGGLGTAARGVERGYEYATSWAMPPREIIDLAVPMYSGILDNYWGASHFKLHMEYFGILTILFALFTIILYRKKAYVKFFTFSSLVVFLIAIGGATPFFRIFYTLIPGFKLFRAPNLAFYLFSFSFIVVAAIGFEHIFIKGYEGNDKMIFKKRFYIIAGLLIALFIIIGFVCVAARDSITQSTQRALRTEFISTFGQRTAEVKLANFSNNFPQFIQGIWRSLAFLVMLLFLVYISLTKRVKPFIFVIVAIAITLVDQLPLMAKFLPEGPEPKTYYAGDDVVRFLTKDKTVFRVFPTPWYEHTSDLYLLYHDIQSAGGYIPNPIQRYQEFIGAGTSVMFRPTHLLQFPKFTDMLNIKYIIAPTLPEDVSRYDMQSQMIIEEIKLYLSRFSLVFGGRKYSVYLNRNMQPRASIVPDYRVLTESEIVDFLKSDEFDSNQTVVLEKDPQVPHPGEKLPMIEASILHYSANKIICTTESLYPGFLVLADNWHPDWKVFIDGEESVLFRANHTFRAVYLTPGEHEVVFAYISSYFNVGKIISIIVLVLTIGFCIFATRFKI